MQGADECSERLKAMRQGEVLVSLAAGPEPQAVLLVRERSAVIKYFGETGVEVRAARFTLGQVMVAAMAFRLGRSVPIVYAALLDCYGRDGAGIFQALARQEYIPIYFYGDNCRRDRTFVTMNQMQTFFTTFPAAVRAMPRWNGDDFAAAAARLMSRFPTPGALWAALQG
ncbi:hypothetical protein EG829_03325 [bacterium]|nr:hypothetical protein [bacterium]